MQMAQVRNLPFRREAMGRALNVIREVEGADLLVWVLSGSGLLCC